MSIRTSARFGMLTFPGRPALVMWLTIPPARAAGRSSHMISLEPIGHVRSSRADLSDDNWAGVTARIELVEALPAESLDGIETFSHAEVVYFFDRVPDAE